MFRRLTLHQLVIFAALANHRSMTRAAGELHMTTPALSIQVKKMAESIGAPLHEQIGRGIHLTEAGELVAIAAREVLQRLEALGAELAELEGLKKGKLRLSIITTAKYFVPKLLGAFCQRYPGIDVSLEVSNRDQCLHRMNQNLDDLYIMGQVPEQLDVIAVPFMENPLLVIAPHDHPLVAQRAISPARLASEAFVMREQGSGTRLTAERFFAKQGTRLRARMTLGSNEAVKQAVVGGLGLAVLSNHTLTLDRASGAFAILDVEGFPLLRKWYAVYPRGKRVSTVARAFLQHLIEEGEKTD